ncbi:MAG: nicotinate-nucleotide adenylyltransferase [Microthrixaceae bacterium]
MIRRVGVLGGTFDPPHIGHLVPAMEARDALGLDVVLLVVAGDPWQKSAVRAVTPAEVRCDLVRRAAAGVDGLEVSDLEVRRPGPSYTIDTMEALAAERPADELVLLLGADAAAGLPTWHRWEELRRWPLGVLERPGHTGGPPDGFEVRRVTVSRLEVSSSEVRDRVARGRSVRFLVPEAPLAEIARLGLYRDAR